jgi:hypothetical protein
LAQVTSGGSIQSSANVTAGTLTALGRLTVDTGAVGTIGAVVRGVASQSANLQSWQLSDSTEVVRVRSGGQVGIGSLITGTSFAINNDVVGGSGSAAMVIRGASGQTANLIEMQNSAAALRHRFTDSGRIYSSQSGTFGSTSDNSGTLAVLSTGSTTIGAVVRGASGQTANLLELQDSSANILASFSATGSLSIPATGILPKFMRVGGAAYLGTMSVLAESASTIGAVIRGAASQTADLMQWQNSAATVLSKMQADGGASFAQGNATIGSGGIIRGTQVSTNVDYSSLREENSGGLLRLTKQTAAAANPASGQAKIYLRDGTTAGTLKLVVRAGAAGAETTILDNIPQ